MEPVKTETRRARVTMVWELDATSGTYVGGAVMSTGWFEDPAALLKQCDPNRATLTIQWIDEA